MKIKWLLPFICMVFVLTACSGQADQITDINSMQSADKANDQSAAETENKNDTANDIKEAADTTDITITIADTVITATLDNSETTKDFLATLPRTITMDEYGGREFYGGIEKLSENGVQIDNFKNGDVTYFMNGPSFAIFYGREGESSQSGLIRMGKITSDLSVFNTLKAPVDMRIEIANTNTLHTKVVWESEKDTLSEEENEVLTVLLKRFDAMASKDIDTMDELMADDIVLTHMSGATETKEEWLDEIAGGDMQYLHADIIDPAITVDGDKASIDYVSVVEANIYGSHGTWRMSNTAGFEKRNGTWIWTTSPQPVSN